jgi:NAD+ kinase
MGDLQAQGSLLSADGPSAVLRRVGLYYRSDRADIVELLNSLTQWLAAQGVEVWQGLVTDDTLAEAACSLDMIITLGGDGTIVRAVHAAAATGVPILGVNLGRLGFLAEVEPCDVRRVLPRLLAGEYFVEERMMLRTVLQREGKELLAAEAINDVVVGRGRSVRTVRVSVDVDGHYVMTQTCDGVIVSSPTGSTAYCLSAGGPIVAPGLDCMVVTPIAAHLAVAHAIVVPANTTARLRLLKGQGATLTVDGQLDAEVRLGDEVLTSASSSTAKFVRFGDKGYFYETVLRRLRWPDLGPT